MDAISRRTLLTSGGMTAAVAFAGGISPSRACAVETPLHGEDNVIAKSINSDPSRVPTLHGRLENRQIAFVSTIFPNVPGLRLDACCYEPGDGFLRLDLLGMAIPGDNQLILAHRIQNYPGLIHETTLTAEPGAIEAIGRLKVDPKVRVGELEDPHDKSITQHVLGFSQESEFCRRRNCRSSLRRDSEPLPPLDFAVLYLYRAGNDVSGQDRPAENQ